MHYTALVHYVWSCFVTDIPVRAVADQLEGLKVFLCRQFGEQLHVNTQRATH